MCSTWEPVPSAFCNCCCYYLSFFLLFGIVSIATYIVRVVGPTSLDNFFPDSQKKCCNRLRLSHLFPTSSSQQIVRTAGLLILLVLLLMSLFSPSFYVILSVRWFKMELCGAALSVCVLLKIKLVIGAIEEQMGGCLSHCFS